MSDWDEEEDWSVDDEDSETVECSSCGADIYEDAVRCPLCGSYGSANLTGAGRRWTPWIIGVLLTVFIFGWVVRC